MLPLRKASKSVQRPLFCIHPMVGVSVGFSSLLRHLDSKIPVYGLQSRGLRGIENLPASVEEVAADYLDQIRRIQPEGPYRLLGRSLGGLIGHAIAEQMQAQNFQVELLAMIDSSLFISGELARSLTEADEVRAALGFLDIHIPHENRPETLKELGEFLLHPENAHSIPVAQGVMRVAKEIVKSTPEFLKHLSMVMFNNLKLARQFAPRKLNLDLLYFHATEVTGNVDGILDRSPSAWRPFVGGKVEVHELACHHESVLEQAPAAQIGTILQQRLSTPDDQWIPTRVSPVLRGETGAIATVYV
jgi:enterobactin synthetase component F